MKFDRKKQIMLLLIGLIAVFIYFKMTDISAESEYLLEDGIVAEDNGDKASDKFAEIEENQAEIREKDKNNVESDIQNENNSIIVDIKGAVNTPGIVEAPAGSRVADIVKISGGFSESADMNSVNLAKIVSDEDMIYIPHIGEETVPAAESIPAGMPGAGGNAKSSADDGMVNINTADKTELMRLNGVGEATADKIIEYREENKFEAPEDIMNVSGIGEKKYESIKDNIKVR